MVAGPAAGGAPPALATGRTGAGASVIRLRSPVIGTPTRAPPHHSERRTVRHWSLPAGCFVLPPPVRRTGSWEGDCRGAATGRGARTGRVGTRGRLPAGVPRRAR